MGTIIDGKALAARLTDRVGRQVAQLRAQHDITPGLAVVLLGEDPASQVYVRNKGRQATRAGMNSWQHRHPDTLDQRSLLKIISTLNADPAVHGILVQLPLPPHIDSEAVLIAIDPAKDVDGFHPVNVGYLHVGAQGMVPCTPLGCLLMLKEQHADLSGMDAVVVGRSNIVGKPVAALLLRESCTVTITHSKTRDLPGVCRRADILIAAVGRPGMIRGDWIKPGATIIDVGINRVAGADGKTRLAGDVDFDSASEVAGAITPVPGGVGPMTIACLLLNTMLAACRQHALEVPDPGQD